MAQTINISPIQGDIGWVASNLDDRINHFGDCLSCMQVLWMGKSITLRYNFDLSHIPRGTQIHAASLRLTGLRTDLIDKETLGVWRLQLLAPEVDHIWRNLNYEQIHHG